MTEAKTLQIEFKVYWAHNLNMTKFSPKPETLVVPVKDDKEMDKWKTPGKRRGADIGWCLPKDFFAMRRLCQDKSIKPLDPLFTDEFPLGDERSMTLVVFCIDMIDKMSASIVALSSAVKAPAVTQENKSTGPDERLYMSKHLSEDEYAQIKNHLKFYKVKNTGEIGTWCESRMAYDKKTGTFPPTMTEIWVFHEENAVDTKYAHPDVDVAAIIRLLATARLHNLHVYTRRTTFLHQSLRLSVCPVTDKGDMNVDEARKFARGSSAPP